MTDGQLLDHFVKTRDETSFEALVRRHGPMVLGLCRRSLQDDHEAEDAFQTTFLTLVNNARTIRKQDSLGSWLYGVAQRVTLKAKIRAGKRNRLTQGETMAVDDHDSSEADLQEIRPVLHEEVGRLPEKYRAPIVLCYLEGQTHEEAARQLEWPVGTVKGRLSRARELLHSRLSRRGIALSLGLVAILKSEARAAVPESLVESTVRAAGAISNVASSKLLDRSSRPFWRTSGRLVIILGALAAMLIIRSSGGFVPLLAASSKATSEAAESLGLSTLLNGDQGQAGCHTR
jgi:RNA polymerase sigma factor (sigma-70 family)